MGIFDNLNNKKYNDAIPNYAEDGIDIVKCESPGCKYEDVITGRCLFETCIYKQHPFSIPYHIVHTSKCEICNENIIHVYDDDNCHPLIEFSTLCDNCREKLRKLIVGD